MNNLNITNDNYSEILDSLISMMDYEYEDHEWIRIDISKDYELLELLAMYDDEIFVGNYDYWWNDNIEYIVFTAQEIHREGYRIEDWEYNEEKKCIYIRKELNRE